MKKKEVWKKGVGMLLLVSIVVIAGCVGGEKTTTTTTPPSTEEGFIDQGTIVYAYGSDDMTHWDPARCGDVTSAALTNIYEPLLWYPPPGQTEFIPALAVSWEHSEDSKTWTFHLRQGVKFHGGGEWNAEACKKVIERHKDPRMAYAWLWDPVESMEVVDKYTIKFHLKFPYDMRILASGQYSTLMESPYAVEKHEKNGDLAMEWFDEEHADGTGPYYLAERKPGEYTVLKKFDDYWGGWKGKHFSTAIIKVTPETATTEQALIRGEVDIVRWVPLEHLEMLKSMPSIDMIEVEDYKNLMGALNTKKFPTDSKIVRQAISYGFDYKTCVNDLLLGYAIQARGPVVSTIWGWDPNCPQYNYDPEKAKQLLAQDGWKDTDGDGVLEKDGKDLFITATYDTGNEMERKTLELLKANLESIGFKVDVRAIPWDTRWEHARHLETAPNMYVLYWWPDYMDPLSWMKAQYHCEEPIFFNLSYYCNPELDRLMDEGQTYVVTDHEKCLEMYAEAQRIITEEALAIFFWEPKKILVKRADVKGFIKDKGLQGINQAYSEVIFFYPLYREE
ncbi:MAG: ABC transporter substrate-binding protein [Thermoplasmata archaeon]|nr:ABC transporter substrate-binding protein [Thermoplasmata archaeon]